MSEQLKLIDRLEQENAKLKAELEQAKQEGKSLQTQVDRKCEELLRLHDELTRLRDIASEEDVQLIDQALEETKEAR